ncbi:hypothetical protein G3578_14725 [Brevibacillus sp. SYP-B805]|uniref:hypothetical protein n=1 Tax=Brevibacillus sp. SYP-B805 TaxID=1578199 RepID=UPI0013ED28D3|nr:hypothetical protein [Brevibacillus sp. SYP-B805]NGQ96415.1 hypothetical protein [Brevibacillus sp. SYP-B805]
MKPISPSLLVMALVSVLAVLPVHAAARVTPTWSKPWRWGASRAFPFLRPPVSKPACRTASPWSQRKPLLRRT